MSMSFFLYEGMEEAFRSVKDTRISTRDDSLVGEAARKNVAGHVGDNDRKFVRVTENKRTLPYEVSSGRDLLPTKRLRGRYMTKEKKGALDIALDNSKFEAARNKVVSFPRSSATDSRLALFAAIMEARGREPYPLTLIKAQEFLTCVLGGWYGVGEFYYATGDDYMREVISHCRSNEGMMDMSDEDVVTIEKILRHHDRKGVFNHTQPEPQEIDSVAKLSGRCFRAVALLSFLFALRVSETELVDWDKNVSCNEGVFCLDMSKYILKSNHWKKVYVRCLCGEKNGGSVFCPHKLLRDAKDYAGDYKADFARCVGDSRTHCLRISCIYHLVRACVPEMRIRAHGRWKKKDMVDWYNRGNSYSRSKSSELNFVA